MTLAPHPIRSGPCRVLALCGSLRAESSNLLTIEAARSVAPPGLQVEQYDGIGTLPHFNPDLDTDGSRPDAVQAFRSRVASADALLISSPEYAHGVPGSLKNALDWLVSGPEFPAILVALLNPSPRSIYAQTALTETLKTMSGEIVTEACVTMPLSGRRLTLDQFLADPALIDPLRLAMAALERAVARAREEGRRLIP